MILNGFVWLSIVTFLKSNTESKRNIVTNNKSMNFLNKEGEGQNYNTTDGYRWFGDDTK